MADFDYNTRRAISDRRRAELDRRIEKLSGHDKELARELVEKGRTGGDQVGRIANQFYAKEEKTPSQWFGQKGLLPGSRVHKGLLDAFVPKQYQESYLYIIDKLNQFPFSRGWSRRTVRTAGYGPQIRQVFSLLTAYEKLFYCGEKLEDFIYRRLDEEKLDYIKHEWSFTYNFSLIYAAEIDRGNQAVIDALKDLILSENNTAYLDREMILGIIRSDNRELQKLLCGLLLAARLQEGLRQVICEAMDEGTKDAFLGLLKVIEENNLIRYSSVKRSVSTWIGIFDEKSVDRVNDKLLKLMGQCLRNREFCEEQLKTNDSIAISAALWALGFVEAENAIDAMTKLIDYGTKNQKLTASFYNQNLFDDSLKIRVAKKVVLECTDDLELVAAFMPAFTTKLYGQINGLLENRYGRDVTKPKKPVLTDYYEDRADAERQYETFMSINERLPKKGVVYDPCIFPWYRVALMPSEIVRQLAFTAYVLQDEEKITKAAALLGEVSGNRAYLLNLLLYAPANQTQRELLIGYMGNAEEYTSSKAILLVKDLTLEDGEYRLLEDMLRFKRSKLRSELLELLMGQDDRCMEECLKRLLADKKEEKRTAGLDLLLRLRDKEEKKAFYQSVKGLAAGIEKPTDKEKVMLEEILEEKETSVTDQKGYGIYNPDAPELIPEWEEGRDAVLKCLPLPEKEIDEKIKKLDTFIRENRNYEYSRVSGDKELLGNYYAPTKEGGIRGTYRERYRLEYYPLADQFRNFYEKEIGDYGTFVEWEAKAVSQNAEIYRNSLPFYKAVFGSTPFKPEPLGMEYQRQLGSVRINYRHEFLDKRLLFEAGVEAVKALTPVINNKNKHIPWHYTRWDGKKQEQTTNIGDIRFFDRFFEGLKYWETDEEFKRAFYTAWGFELKCREEREQSRFLPVVQTYNSLSAEPYAVAAVFRGGDGAGDPGPGRGHCRQGYLVRQTGAGAL